MRQFRSQILKCVSRVQGFLFTKITYSIYFCFSYLFLFRFRVIVFFLCSATFPFLFFLSFFSIFSFFPCHFFFIFIFFPLISFCLRFLVSSYSFHFQFLPFSVSFVFLFLIFFFSPFFKFHAFGKIWGHCPASNRNIIKPKFSALQVKCITDRCSSRTAFSFQMRPRISIRACFRPSLRWSVRPSVCI